MLVLRFQVGDGHYALDAGDVIEVLPMVAVTAIPRAPAGVAGMFSHHGSLVPAIDLGELMVDRPSPRRLNTRLVLVRYPVGPGATRPLGLIAERVTEIERRDRSRFTPSGVTTADAPYLGPVATDSRGLLQWIDLGALLPAPVRDVLFREPVVTSCSTPTSASC